MSSSLGTFWGIPFQEVVLAGAAIETFLPPKQIDLGQIVYARDIDTFFERIIDNGGNPAWRPTSIGPNSGGLGSAIVFVSPTGNDSAAGTITAPIQTIAEANRRVIRPGFAKRRIILANGTYPLGTLQTFMPDAATGNDGPVVYQAASFATVLTSTATNADTQNITASLGGGAPADDALVGKTIIFSTGNARFQRRSIRGNTTTAGVTTIRLQEGMFPGWAIGDSFTVQQPAVIFTYDNLQFLSIAPQNGDYQFVSIGVRWQANTNASTFVLDNNTMFAFGSSEIFLNSSTIRIDEGSLIGGTIPATLISDIAGFGDIPCGAFISSTPTGVGAQAQGLTLTREANATGRFVFKDMPPIAAFQDCAMDLVAIEMDDVPGLFFFGGRFSHMANPANEGRIRNGVHPTLSAPGFVLDDQSFGQVFSLDISHMQDTAVVLRGISQLRPVFIPGVPQVTGSQNAGGLAVEPGSFAGITAGMTVTGTNEVVAGIYPAPTVTTYAAFAPAGFLKDPTNAAIAVAFIPASFP